MTVSRTRVQTANASKYLQQLCKHVSHRVTAEFDAHRGRIPFGDGGGIDLAADAEGLDITVTGADSAALDRLEGFVVSHIERFAFRETLAFDWQRADTPA